MESSNTIDTISTVSKIWLGGNPKIYPTLHIIPLELARKYKLDKPCKIVLTPMPDMNGILIRRYEGDSDSNNEHATKS